VAGSTASGGPCGRMILRSSDIDELRRLATVGRAVPQIEYAGCELGASLELACTKKFLEGFDHAAQALGVIETWVAQDEQLAQSVRALDGRERDVARFAAPTREVVPLGTRESIENHAAGFFDRFRRSLKSSGFGRLADAIAKAMFDMADNAVQHSGPDEYEPEPGAMGYEVSDRAASFAVVDLGRGVLASLRTNPKWVHLGSSEAALDAAVRRSASRRTGEGNGHGFSDLHRALADLTGRLRFASGDSVLKLEGHPEERVVAWDTRSELVGLQLSISLQL
jgi:hypothetical protein